MAEEDVRGEVVPTTSDHNGGDGEEGVKTETETQVLSPLENKIVRQVEVFH